MNESRCYHDWTQDHESDRCHDCDNEVPEPLWLEENNGPRWDHWSTKPISPAPSTDERR